MKNYLIIFNQPSSLDCYIRNENVFTIIEEIEKINLKLDDSKKN